MKNVFSNSASGLNPSFYIRFWSLCGDDITTACISWLDGGNFLASVNEITSVLVPKCDKPLCMKDFHPFSLCNVIYKIFF